MAGKITQQIRAIVNNFEDKTDNVRMGNLEPTPELKAELENLMIQIKNLTEIALNDIFINKT